MQKRIQKLWQSCRLKYRHGLSLEEYNGMLERQKGVCAICGNQNKYKKHKKNASLSVDHCHKTDKVRGLLCDACNLALGLMKDDVDNLKKAVKYLVLHKKNE